MPVLLDISKDAKAEPRGTFESDILRFTKYGQGRIIVSQSQYRRAVKLCAAGIGLFQFPGTSIPGVRIPDSISRDTLFFCYCETSARPASLSFLTSRMKSRTPTSLGSFWRIFAKRAGSWL